MFEDSDDGLVSNGRRTALKALGATGVAGVVGSTGAAAAGPTAVIEANPLPVEEGESFTLDGSSSSGDIDKYEWYRRNWTFGSSFSSTPSATGQTLTDSYVADPWGFKLVVTDVNGNTDSAVLNANVYAQGALQPNAVIEAAPESSERHAFTGLRSTTPRGTIDKYEWNFYNTSFQSSFDSEPDRTGPDWSEALASGYTWKIRLRVTNSDGRTDKHVITYKPQ